MLTGAPLGISVPAGKSSNAVFLPLMVTLRSTFVIQSSILTSAALAAFWDKLLLFIPSVAVSAASCVVILLFAVFFFTAVVDSAFFFRVVASSFFVSASVEASCVVVSSFFEAVSCVVVEAAVLSPVFSISESSPSAPVFASLSSSTDWIAAEFSANTPRTFDVPVEVQNIDSTRTTTKNNFPARFIVNLPSSVLLCLYYCIFMSLLIEIQKEIILDFTSFCKHICYFI